MKPPYTDRDLNIWEKKILHAFDPRVLCPAHIFLVNAYKTFRAWGWKILLASMHHFCYFIFYYLQQSELTASCYLLHGTVGWKRITDQLELIFLRVGVLVYIIYLIAIDGSRFPSSQPQQRLFHCRKWNGKATSMEIEGIHRQNRLIRQSGCHVTRSHHHV